jgi:hypothetical protein
MNKQVFCVKQTKILIYCVGLHLILNIWVVPFGIFIVIIIHQIGLGKTTLSSISCYRLDSSKLKFI